MGPLWLSLGALQRHDGLTEWEETRSAAGSSRDGSGAGWGGLGLLGGGATGQHMEFRGATCEPKHLFFWGLWV